MTLLLGLLLWAAAARADPPRLDAEALALPCPLDVGRACRGYCQRGSRPETCPFRGFTCDFKLCYGTMPSGADPDIFRVLADSSSYIRRGDPAPFGGVNDLSQVRIVAASDYSYESDRRGLYLVRGQFVQRVPDTADPAQTADIVLRGNACARWAKQRDDSHAIEDTERSAEVFRVGCYPNVGPRGRVALTPVANLRQSDFIGPPRGPRPPPAAEAAAPAANGGPPGSGPSMAEVERLRSLDAPRLEAYLRRGGHVSLDRRRMLVDGVNLHGRDENEAEDRNNAWTSLTPDEVVAVKELSNRYYHDALSEAQSRRPAPEGQFWDYDSDSGEAVLRQNSTGPVKIPKNP